MAVETYYDEDGNPEQVYVKEEPDCYTCSDTGRVWVDSAGSLRYPRDEQGGRLTETNCPECCPTEEQHAAAVARAERRREEIEEGWLAAGGIAYDEDPWA